MRIDRHARGTDVQRLQMAAMIDIVFLLLVFFVMTFRIVLPEGDLPLGDSRQGGGPPVLAAPMTIDVYLASADDGRLSEIRAGQQPVESVAALRAVVIDIAGEPGSSAAEQPRVEIHADPRLDYRHLIDAITAVKGYVDTNGQTVAIAGDIVLAK